MFGLAAFLGLGTNLCTQIVNVIDAIGWAGIVVSTVAAIISCGGLSVASATIDYIIIVVMNYCKNNLKAQAIIW